MYDFIITFILIYSFIWMMSDDNQPNSKNDPESHD